MKELCYLLTSQYTGTLVGTLQGTHLISGNFHIIDSKTIFLENFNYDGGAPGLTYRFIVKASSQAHSQLNGGINTEKEPGNLWE